MTETPTRQGDLQNAEAVLRLQNGIRVAIAIGFFFQFLTGIGALFAHGNAGAIVLPVLFGAAFPISRRAPTQVMFAIVAVAVVTEFAWPQLDNTVTTGMAFVRALFWVALAVGAFGAFKLLNHG